MNKDETLPVDETLGIAVSTKEFNLPPVTITIPRNLVSQLERELYKLPFTQHDSPAVWAVWNGVLEFVRAND